MKRYVLSAAFTLVLGLAACTDSDTQAPEPKQEKAPVNAPASPGPAPKTPEPKPIEVPEPAPPYTDNCGLNPADMDYKTKVQCGLVTEPPEQAPEPEPEVTSCAEGMTLVPESPIDPYCDGGGPAVGPDDSGGLSFTEKCQQGILGVEDGCASAFTPEDDGPGSMYTNPEAYEENTGRELTPQDFQEGCELGYLPPEQC